MIRNKILLVSLLLVTVVGHTLAQNSTSSPYSRFGYGELANTRYGKSFAMGGTAIGMRAQNSINNMNPAAYTAIDSMTFLFEFGAMGKQSWYATEDQKYRKFSANLEYFALELPIGKYLGFSAGMQPYSYVGYSVNETGTTPFTDTESSVHWTKSFTGKGGISEIYGGLSGKIGKHLAAGINLQYLYGNIDNMRQLSFDETEVGYATTTQTIGLRVTDINFRYGLQYFTDLNEKERLTAGVIFENKTKLDGTLVVGTSGVDTTEMKSGSAFELPMMIGAGLSYEIKKKLTLAADFSYTDWASCKYYDFDEAGDMQKANSLVSQTQFAVGGEFIPDINAKNYLKRIRYRAGFHYSTGYIEMNNYVPDNYGITFGMGLPIRGKSLVNIGAEYGKTGSTEQLREDYLKFTISASFGETWFFKRRFE